MKEFSKKALIIDDSVAYYRLFMESMIDNDDDQFFDNILFADNGNTGYEMYVEHRPMVVFLDVRMPGISGIDVAKKIIEYDPTATIMFVTNYSNDPEVSKLISDRLVTGKIDKGIGVSVISSMIAVFLKTVSKLI